MGVPGTRERIRQATLDDAAELARLRWDFSPDEVAASGQAFESFAAGFEAFLRRALPSGLWSIWAAERDGRLIGNVYVERVPKVPRPGRFGAMWGYVTNVYVEPRLRGQGVGTRLMGRIVEWARAQGLELLIVWPSDESVEFYRRAGFSRSPDILELPLDG